LTVFSDNRPAQPWQTRVSDSVPSPEAPNSGQAKPGPATSGEQAAQSPGKTPTPTAGVATEAAAADAARVAEADAAKNRAAAVESAARSQRAAESETLTERGLQLARSAQWRSAIEPLRRATELDSGNAAAFYHLGDAYNHTDALGAALEAFEAAARLQPDHWRALKGVGIVLDRMRRPQEASAAYQRAREAQSRAAGH
jgi:tetratricopeptide (TPR) repeat protein